MQRRWLKGDTHLHTTNSDGHYHQYELIEKCKKLGLDWIIITDHNYNTVEENYSSDGLQVIQGEEVTGENGHVNVWGTVIKDDKPYDLSDLDAYKKITKKAKKNGGIISVNHPFCSNCPFRLDIDDFDMDCVEVWNTIQHTDNVKNLKWWVKKLDEGKRIAAVGGSDFHRNYAGVDLLAAPTTIVHAKSNKADDVLEALKEGRSVVTSRPNTSMIYLSVEDAQVGDTVKLDGAATGIVKATKLMPGFILRVYNNDKLVHEHKASGFEREYEAHFGVREKGYVRAEIDYKLKPVFKKVFSIAESQVLSARNATAPETASELFWAFTNPIWIE
ncbi:MAG: PHP domain-containing protein [Eubacterium sp.]|nr:PHP domain-containing protein [Eubacterium sp.]